MKKLVVLLNLLSCAYGIPVDCHLQVNPTEDLRADTEKASERVFQATGCGVEIVDEGGILISRKHTLSVGDTQVCGVANHEARKNSKRVISNTDIRITDNYQLNCPETEDIIIHELFHMFMNPIGAVGNNTHAASGVFADPIGEAIINKDVLDTVCPVMQCNWKIPETLQIGAKID